MSHRFEWSEANLTGFYVASAGEQLGEDVVDDVALVLGTVGGSESYVIEGSQEDILRLLGRCIVTVLDPGGDDEEEPDPYEHVSTVQVADELL